MFKIIYNFSYFQLLATVIVGNKQMNFISGEQFGLLFYPVEHTTRAEEILKQSAQNQGEQKGRMEDEHSGCCVRRGWPTTALARRRKQALQSTQQSQYWLGHLEALQRGSGRLHTSRAADGTPGFFRGRAEETKPASHNCLHKPPQAGFAPARPGSVEQAAELAGHP